MIAKKEEIKKVIYMEPNGKPVLEIVINKYRRDFGGNYKDYIIVYTAFGAIAKRYKDKLVSGNEIKITYRIEAKEYNSNFYTTLIVEKLEVLGVIPKDLFSNSNMKKELSSDAEKYFINKDDVF